MTKQYRRQIIPNPHIMYSLKCDDSFETVAIYECSLVRANIHR